MHVCCSASLRFKEMILKQRNPHPRDSNIVFHKRQHTYEIRRGGTSELAAVSVTSLCKPYFTQFDARLVVDQHYETWKSRPNNKYYPMIHTALQNGSNDADIKASIRDMWAVIGNEASSAGTYMHDRAEQVCNGIDSAEGDFEMDILKTWLRDFQPEMRWKPYRTEWMLWWDEPRLSGAILVAGTLDLLLRSETTGEYALVDFKRTNPHPKYEGGTPNLLGPCPNTKYHPGYASSPLSEIEDSKYGAYCMQLNVLSKMLRERYNIDVGQHMYLLQVHIDMEYSHCIRVPVYSDATNSVFAIETERLFS